MIADIRTAARDNVLIDYDSLTDSRIWRNVCEREDRVRKRKPQRARPLHELKTNIREPGCTNYRDLVPIYAIEPAPISQHRQVVDHPPVVCAIFINESNRCYSFALLRLTVQNLSDFAPV